MKKIALKKIKSTDPEEGINFTAVREIKLLREFKHENILELVECFATSDLGICLVYECCLPIDLQNIIENKEISMTMADIKQYLLQLLSAVEACHKRNILHRDLKPDNCFFLADGTMKLGDFGLARLYGTPKTRLSPEPITLWYKPPEMLLGATEYCAAVDMWSVGCIFAQMILRKPFLEGISDISQLDKIFGVFGTPTEANWPGYSTLPLPSRGLTWDDAPPIPLDEFFPTATKDVLSLLKSVLVLDPLQRFTASQCLSHPYFLNQPSPTPRSRLQLDKVTL